MATKSGKNPARIPGRAVDDEDPGRSPMDGRGMTEIPEQHDDGVRPEGGPVGKNRAGRDEADPARTGR